MTIIKFMENFNSLGVLVDQITIKHYESKKVMLKTNRHDYVYECIKSFELGEHSEITAFRFYPYTKSLILLINTNSEWKVV